MWYELALTFLSTLMKLWGKPTWHFKYQRHWRLLFTIRQTNSKCPICVTRLRNNSCASVLEHFKKDRSGEFSVLLLERDLTFWASKTGIVVSLCVEWWDETLYFSLISVVFLQWYCGQYGIESAALIIRERRIFFFF